MKDATIQMLSIWIADQDSGPEANTALKRVWESVLAASTAAKIKDRKEEGGEEEEEEKEEESETSHGLATDSTSPYDSLIPIERQHMEIVRNPYSGERDNAEDIDLCGGIPNADERTAVALQVSSLSLAWELGRSFHLHDDTIVQFVAISDHAAINRLASQILNKWRTRIKEKKVEMKKLLKVYNIDESDTAGHDAISKEICTAQELHGLSRRLNLTASDVLQTMSSCLTFQPLEIRHIVLKMFGQWVQLGGTRRRLLQIVQAFNFYDAADKIATAMKHHPGFIDAFSHGIIDHNGGQLKLDEPDIRVSIPEGAIPQGMKSVITLNVPFRSSSKIPINDGEVLITPDIECSVSRELLKPVTVHLPHCIHLEQSGLSNVRCYIKMQSGTFRRMSLNDTNTRVSEGRVVFDTRHLQLFALSSTSVRGVPFTCQVSRPLSVPPSHEPALRICMAHPCNRCPEEMRKRRGNSVEPSYSVETVKFTIESKKNDLKLSYLCGSQIVRKIVPIRSLLIGGSNTLHFTLSAQEVPESCLRIEQGTSKRMEKQITITREDKPDYGDSRRRGRTMYVSDNMLKTLSESVTSLKDARVLGYKLGFYHSAVERYLDRSDSSAISVSRSGCLEMLHDWRWQVRPNEQAQQLRLALNRPQLWYAYDVLFNTSGP